MYTGKAIHTYVFGLFGLPTFIGYLGRVEQQGVIWSEAPLEVLLDLNQNKKEIIENQTCEGKGEVALVVLLRLVELKDALPIR